MIGKCERGGCERPIKAHGLCQMHYDRERGRHRHREDRVLPTRARNRAVSELIRLHKDEFEELYATALRTVREEHERIAKLAKEHGVEVADARRIFRLKRGPAAEDQEPEDRVQLTSTDSSCVACGTFHAAGHACACATNKKLETGNQSTAPARNVRAIHGGRRETALGPQFPQIERALRAGKSAQWVSANLGEPMVVVMTVLQRLRKEQAV